MYAVRLWSVRHARGLNAFYRGFEARAGAHAPAVPGIGLRAHRAAGGGVEKAVKGLLFDCRMCGQCVLSSTGMSCPMNCPKSLRNGPCGGVRANGNCEVKPDMRCVWVEAYRGSRAHPGRHRGDGARCSSRSISASRAAPRGCDVVREKAEAERDPRGCAMRFEDEPVPGYPAADPARPYLAGALRARAARRRFRGHHRACAAGFRGSRGCVQARAGVRRLRRCHQCDRRQRRELPHVESRGVRAADARRLCADHADLLPRQESHRDSGRYSRRRRDGRLQHAVPDRRRRAGGRSSAGETGVRSGLRVAARHRAHPAR